MFKHMKVVTGLWVVLVLFGALQLLAGGLFFNFLQNDKDNFAVLPIIYNQQSVLSDSRVNLLQTTDTINRAGFRYIMGSNYLGNDPAVHELVAAAKDTLAVAMQNFNNYEQISRDSGQYSPAAQKLKQSFKQYVAALTELIQLMAEGKIKEFFAQPTGSFQNIFEQDYHHYLLENDRSYASIFEQSNQSFSIIKTILLMIVVVLLAVIVMVWYALRHLLINPLNRQVEHIKNMANGDLTKFINITSSNEIGALAANLQQMQSELIRTVGSVRQGADAIYCSASEIAAGNSNLSARTEQQAASLEETAASMEQLTATVKKMQKTLVRLVS